MEIAAGLFYGEARVRGVDPPGDVWPDEREARRRLVAVAEGKRVTCISGWPKDFEIELTD